MTRTLEPKVTVLVTGATGYIGGRLVPRLLDSGYHVRCLSRSARKLDARDWSKHPRLQIIEGDAAKLEDVICAMQDCTAAYYFVHSMLVAGAAYRTHDRELAETFSKAADISGVEQIIYLGGLGETGDGLSEHLRSRREVEKALSQGKVPVTVFRAAMIIGSGSASFEILRYLVERLPAMVTPRWVNTESQPIAVRDVLRYLEQCLDVPHSKGQTLDIGGKDILSYRELMQLMAHHLGLSRRIIVPLPVLSPRLSSLWIHLVTPIDKRIARPLAEGLRNRVVLRDNRAAELMPGSIQSASEAIAAALGKLDTDEIETAWMDAGPIPGDPDFSGGTVFTDTRSANVNAQAQQVFNAVCRIGGGHGYYHADWLWRLRGWMDRLIGGPGLRRGRRNPLRVSYGEALDFWRVTDIVEARYLELRAEMKLPGIATLDFRIEPDEARHNRCTLIQTARFKPKGLLGLVYWYLVLPLHGIVFKGMLSGIKNAAEGAAN
ncbi:MAG: SDR family oxidoreductase [Myxococcales bacterium]|nr:MAG: SDR family oxidoreductase [Myxococcales bacterium]